MSYFSQSYLYPCRRCMGKLGLLWTSSQLRWRRPGEILQERRSSWMMRVSWIQSMLCFLMYVQLLEFWGWEFAKSLHIIASFCQVKTHPASLQSWTHGWIRHWLAWTMVFADVMLSRLWSTSTCHHAVWCPAQRCISALGRQHACFINTQKVLWLWCSSQIERPMCGWPRPSVFMV